MGPGHLPLVGPYSPSDYITGVLQGFNDGRGHKPKHSRLFERVSSPWSSAGVSTPRRCRKGGGESFLMVQGVPRIGERRGEQRTKNKKREQSRVPKRWSEVTRGEL